MLRWLWPFIKPYRKQFALAVSALVMTASLTLSLGQGLRLMMDQGFAAGSQQGLEQAIAVFAGIVLLMSLGAFMRFYWVSWLGERVVADIRQQLYRHLLTLPPSFFEDNLAGEIQSRVTTDTTLLQTVIGSSLSFAVRNSLLFVGGLAKEPLDNSAQLCASAAGFQNETALVGNGQPFSAAPTTLWMSAVRALRGSPENFDSVSPVLALDD